MKKNQKKERILACCDICVHYEYDEDAGEVIYGLAG